MTSRSDAPILRVTRDSVTGAPLPSYASLGAAGLDLPCREGGHLVPGERRMFPTGLTVAIPDGYFGHVRPRSGLALQYGVHTLAGVIDSDYRGEVQVILVNLGLAAVTFLPGDRIAQLLICPVARVEVREVAPHEMSRTARGANGLGSTGVR